MTRNNNYNNYSNVPDELKSLSQWVLHDENKVPYNPNNLKRASANKPETWASFEKAIEVLDKNKRFTGLGVELDNNGIVGIDIDHCIDEQTGKVNSEALEIVQILDSYTEYSPSGTGLHIFVKGDIPDSGRKNGEKRLEFYKARHYLTITGNSFEEVKPIRERTSEVMTLFQKYFSEKNIKDENETDEEQEYSDDEEAQALEDLVLYDQILNSKNGEAFQKLWAGDWAGTYPSPSEADMALCGQLAFWTCKNSSQMDRMFRQSGLYRDKWNRALGETTYGEDTIRKAIRNCKKVYGQTTNSESVKKNFETFSAKELMRKNIAPMNWIVKDLIPEGLTLLVAPSKAGKSWFALDLCLSVSKGLPFLNIPTEKREVLYIALEDSERRLQERMRKLSDSEIFDNESEIDDNFRYALAIGGLEFGFEEALEQNFDEHPNLALIVIDVLQRIRNNSNSKNVYAQDYTDLGVIKSLADRHKCAIVVIHHTKKGKDDSDVYNQISGSTGIMGVADTTLLINRQKRNESNAILHITGRDVYGKDLAIVFDNNSCKWKYLGDGSHYEETQKLNAHKQNPIVRTIKYLLNDNKTWQGRTSDLQKEIQQQTGIDIPSITLGKSIMNTKFQEDLSAYDCISYEQTKPKNQTTHKFYIDEWPA